MWWAWIYTTWMVNWFDPRSVVVRVVLMGVALASLLMSAAIPTAFSDSAPLFACAYVAMQVGRNVAQMLLVRRGDPLRPLFEQVVAWSCASGILWIAGAFAASSARVALWGAALAVDLVAPWVGFRTPWLGRSRTGDWDVEGWHFAERFQAFLIIALGESIIVTGATASARGLSMGSGFALASAFVISGALCWLYFDQVAEQAQRHIASSEDPGRLARDAYSYLHLPIVVGIIMVAIADDLLIAHPDAPLATTGVVMMVAGPAVYLVGESLVRLRISNTLSPRRLLALFALGLLGVLGGHLPALALSTGVAAILVGLTVWDHERSRSASGLLGWVSVHRGARFRRTGFTTEAELCE